MVKTTISVIKADVGSVAGHHRPHKKMLDYAREKLAEAKESGLIKSFYVYHVGDDIGLVMTHHKGENNPEIHKLAWDTFKEITEITRLSLYICISKTFIQALSTRIYTIRLTIFET